MHECPICGNGTDCHQDLPADNPYWVCLPCDFWFQDPKPQKKYEADEEKGADGRSAGHVLSEQDRAITANLARAWFHNHLAPLGKTPTRTLDVGSKYPYFSHILKKDCGCDAWALDAMDYDDPEKEPILFQYEKELEVNTVLLDFEAITAKELLGQIADLQDAKKVQGFDGISLIHVFEHIYNPLAGLFKMSQLLNRQHSVFIRMPDHQVPGFENHLSPRHYQVHPYFYSEKSFRGLLALYREKGLGNPELLETYSIGGGVRDYLLRFNPGA
jgi:hypothetical protein